jgi:hypothetical protein
MADHRTFELDALTVRPGTYFNPQTEVLLVIDDSPEMGSEIFNMEEFEGAEWVLISDELPIDENQRDELLERFQVRHGPDGDGRVADPDEDQPEVEEFEERDLEHEADAEADHSQADSQADH